MTTHTRSGLIVTVLTLSLLCGTAFYLVGLSFLHRTSRTTDNSTTLETVADEISTRLTHLTAQLEAQASQVTDLGTLLARVTKAVAFTVTFSSREVLELAENQTLRFDEVLLNAASGYNPLTGVFTAPTPGLYAFSIRVVQHPLDKDRCVEVGLYHGPDRKVTTASSCTGSGETGSHTAVLPLLLGDTVHVRMGSGTSLRGHGFTSFSGTRL